MMNTEDKPKSSKPLTELAVGTLGTIVTIKFDSEILGQFLGMGILPGAQVEVLAGGGSGHKPLFLGIGDTRIALGQEYARQIFVETDPLSRKSGIKSE